MKPCRTSALRSAAFVALGALCASFAHGGQAKRFTVRPAAANVVERRCAGCHGARKSSLPRSLSDETSFSFWMPNLSDRRIRRNRHIVFNLSRPEKSLMLLAPLAKEAGGHGTCRVGEADGNQPPACFQAAWSVQPGQPVKQLAVCDIGERVRLGEYAEVTVVLQGGGLGHGIVPPVAAVGPAEREG